MERMDAGTGSSGRFRCKERLASGADCPWTGNSTGGCTSHAQRGHRLDGYASFRQIPLDARKRPGGKQQKQPTDRLGGASVAKVCPGVGRGSGAVGHLLRPYRQTDHFVLVPALSQLPGCPT